MPPSLLTAADCTSHVHLIIGTGPLASSRCGKSLEVGAIPILIASESTNVHYGLQKRVEEHNLRWIKRDFALSDLTTLGREDIDHVVDAVFVTSGAESSQAASISQLCKKMRIPLNVADSASLSTFTLLSTHNEGSLQIGVTTNGKGCKLSARIKREIVASLPQGIGGVVERLGTVRRKIKEQDNANQIINSEQTSIDLVDGEDDDAGQSATFNKLVTQADVDIEAARARRMRWLQQICEYWPLRRLVTISDEDVENILEAYKRETATVQTPNSHHTDRDKESVLNTTTLDARCRRKGRILLAGSGPGHPDLLTTATLKAIQSADVILADKLVPGPVLELVPRRTPVHVAKKFPGNADNAQDQFNQLALDALNDGKIVLRLKQGDPYLYGRGAEEVMFFREHGYEAVVLPGITSSLSAPLFAKIPVTHRAVSDQVLVCTGTGRKGASPNPPPHLPNQTVVFLMALHRLQDLVTSLTQHATSVYPPRTPCAVIERASCPDQRVIRTTLEYVSTAVEEEGSRPPGLLVVGAVCEVLQKSGTKWVVEDGFQGLEGLDDGVADVLGSVTDDVRENVLYDKADPIVSELGSAESKRALSLVEDRTNVASVSVAG